MDRRTFEQLVSRWRSWLQSPELEHQSIARQMLEACADDLEAAILVAFDSEEAPGPTANDQSTAERQYAEDVFDAPTITDNEWNLDSLGGS